MAPISVTALVAGALSVGLAAWTLWPRAEPQPVNRFGHDLPAGFVFRARAPVIAFAPDGRAFVCNTNRGLYFRAMGELEGRLIPGTEGGMTSPFFSPWGSRSRDVVSPHHP